MAKVTKLKRPELTTKDNIYLIGIAKGAFITLKHAFISVFGKSRGADSLASSGTGVTMQYPEQKWDDHLPRS